MQVGLGIYLVVDFTSGALSSKTKSFVYYIVLCPSLPENEVLYHTMLLEVGIVLVKAVSWPPRLILNWAMPECHNHHDLHNIRYAKAHGVDGSGTEQNS